MNGVHDMGGMQDFGPVQKEENEPVFHEEWEGRVFALVRAVRLGPKWNIDMSRFAAERLPPVQYLSLPYYERWLIGLEKRLVDAGVVTPEEMADGKPRPGGAQIPVLTREEVEKSLKPWQSKREDVQVPATFKVGDRVRARNINPPKHTRLPRYIRGHHGVVTRDLGVMSFPDSWVDRMDPKPQHVYSVRFEAPELWGPEAASNDAVYTDMWDDYLELDPA
jgi:nitrile hydratase